MNIIDFIECLLEALEYTKLMIVQLTILSRGMVMELTDSIHEYRYVKVIGHCKNCGNDIYKCESRLNFEGLLEKIIRSESKIENLGDKLDTLIESWTKWSNLLTSELPTWVVTIIVILIIFMIEKHL